MPCRVLTTNTINNMMNTKYLFVLIVVILEGVRDTTQQASFYAGLRPHGHGYPEVSDRFKDGVENRLGDEKTDVNVVRDKYLNEYLANLKPNEQPEWYKQQLSNQQGNNQQIAQGLNPPIANGQQTATIPGTVNNQQSLNNRQFDTNQQQAINSNQPSLPVNNQQLPVNNLQATNQQQGTNRRPTINQQVNNQPLQSRPNNQQVYNQYPATNQQKAGNPRPATNQQVNDQYPAVNLLSSNSQPAANNQPQSINNPTQQDDPLSRPYENTDPQAKSANSPNLNKGTNGDSAFVDPLSIPYKNSN